MYWAAKKFLWLTYCDIHFSGLEPNPHWLQGIPVLSECKGGCESENPHFLPLWWAVNIPGLEKGWENSCSRGNHSVCHKPPSPRPCTKSHRSCLECNLKLGSQEYTESSKADSVLMCLMRSWEVSSESIYISPLTVMVVSEMLFLYFQLIFWCPGLLRL